MFRHLLIIIVGLTGLLVSTPAHAANEVLVAYIDDAGVVTCQRALWGDIDLLSDPRKFVTISVFHDQGASTNRIDHDGHDVISLFTNGVHLMVTTIDVSPAAARRHFFNVTGGGQDLGNVVPSAVAQAANQGETFVSYETTNQDYDAKVDEGRALDLADCTVVP